MKKYNRVSPKFNKRLLQIILFPLCISIFFLWPAFSPISLAMEEGWCIMSVEDCVIYSQPDEEADQMGILLSGQPMLLVNDTYADWYEIYYLGERAYIKKDGTYSSYTASEVKEISDLFEKQEDSTDYLSTLDRIEQMEDQEEKMTIVALGDSIIYGDGLFHQEASYVNLLSHKITGSDVINYGWKASCIAGNFSDRFLDRYMEMDSEAELVLVMGGTNDYGFGVELGNFGDLDDSTFYGGVNMLMSGLKQKYPDSVITFFTPIKRVQGETLNSAGYRLSDYVSAIMEMASFYGIQVIDLYHADELDFTQNTTRFMPDGLHPNTRGHIKMANYIEQVLLGL